MSRAGKLIKILLMMVGMPSAGAALLHNSVKHSPRLAALLIILYELLALLSTIAIKIGKPIFDRRTAEISILADRALGRRLTSYGKEYKRKIASAYRYVDSRGLPTVGAFTPQLSEIFIDIALSPRPPHQISAGIIPQVDATTGVRVFAPELLQGPKGVVIAVVGSPGGGKTTLLQHIAQQTLSERKRDIPIYLALRDIASAVIADTDFTLAAAVRASMKNTLSKEPDGWWESQLSRGKCVVLFDGLDEIAGEKSQRQVSAWIERQVAHYPDNDLIISARPNGYYAAPINGATVYQVQPFNAEQVRLFLTTWSRLAERFGTGEKGTAVDLRADRNTADLLDRLAASPALQDLAINPLLLTMIANVHRYRGALPGSRADLYSEVCQVMLWRRHEAKGLVTKAKGVTKERLLAAIAFNMMEQRVRDLSRVEVLNIIRPTAERASKTLTPEQLLTEMAESGLLVERERDLFAFTHHTFQEYLASKHMKDNAMGHKLCQTVDDFWWAETSLLFVSGADADAIVKACLDSNTTRALTLAFDCADVASELAPDLQEQLAQILARAYGEEPDDDRVALVAGVLADQTVRSFVSTSAGSQICLDPIPARLYSLFLRLTGHPKPCSPPFKPDGTEPVEGVWSADAVAFVAWINTLRESADGLLRLPAVTELADSEVRQRLSTRPQPILAAWGRTADGGSTYLECFNGSDPAGIRGSEIAGAFQRDFDELPVGLLLVTLAASTLAACLDIRTRQSSLYETSNGLNEINAMVQSTVALLDSLNSFTRDASKLALRGKEFERTVKDAIERYNSPAYSRAADKLSVIARTSAQAHVFSRAVASRVPEMLGAGRGAADDFRRAFGFDNVDGIVSVMPNTHHVRISAMLKQSRELAKALHIDFGRSENVVRSLRNDIDLDWVLRSLFGRALAGFVLNSAIKGSGVQPGQDSDFGTSLLLQAGMQREQEFRFNLDSLSDLIAPLSTKDPGYATDRVLHTALASEAKAIFTRRDQLTKHRASAIRLAAISLACHYNGTYLKDRTERYLRIAAAVTLLEGRVSGWLPASEVVLVARG
jgi:hypothetical protein